jgi:RND family efflux transporter MFP subunit
MSFARITSALSSSVVAALLLAGCSSPEASTPAAGADAAGTQGHPIEVAIAPVVEADVAVTVQATGAFAPAEVSDVAPEVAGIVAATLADVGDRVTAGTVLARLSPADAELRLEQARAGLQQAEAALAQAQERHNLARGNATRYDALVKTGDVSKTLQEQAASEATTTRQGVATAEATIADFRSRLAIAQKAVGDTTVRAPFTGFITARPVAVGEYVTSSSIVATVMKLDPIRLRLQVPELEAGRLRPGQMVTATVEALDNRQFSGRITAINPALDTATRATIVEATIANPDGAIRAGMFATAQVALGATERGLFVPRAALLEDPNTNSFRVFTVADGAARLRVVQPGTVGDGRVRVITGIAAGERVVARGVEQLFDGAAVRQVAR